MGEANGVAPGMSGKGASAGGVGALFSALQSAEGASAIGAILARAAPGLTPHADAARGQLAQIWGSARPWSEFFDRRKLTPPSSAGELRERLVDNLTHFAANYLMCFCVVSVASILIHPLSFLGVAAIGVLYVWLFLTQPDAVALGPVVVPAKFKLPVFGVVAICLLWITNAISALGSWALFGVFLSFIHAGARVSAKEPDFESPVETV